MPAGMSIWPCAGRSHRPTGRFMPRRARSRITLFVPGAGGRSRFGPNNSWVAPLLQHRATCYDGAVDEPHLAFTPEHLHCCRRVHNRGYTFGEAAYAAQTWLSWQTTTHRRPALPAVGGRNCRHCTPNWRNAIEQTRWNGRTCIVLNRNAAMGSKPAELSRYNRGDSVAPQSAVLTESCPTCTGPRAAWATRWTRRKRPQKRRGTFNRNSASACS